MIRFACPGCDAAFTVGDEKAGKTGKCPKCATQFLIPDVPAADPSGPHPVPPAPPSTRRVPQPPASGNVVPPPRPAPPPPPPVDDGQDIEIDPCPGCKRRLSVAASDLGGQVECPYCQTVYTATKPGATKPGSSKQRSLDDVLGGAGGRGDDRPSRRRRDEEPEEEERPSRRRRRDEDEEDERPARRSSRAAFDDDEEPRPRRRPRRRPRGGAPHRGGLILTFGILSWVFCGLIFGPMAYFMGKADIAEMDRGTMDEEGRGLTQAGMYIGLAALVITVLGMIAYCGLIVVAIGAGAK